MSQTEAQVSTEEIPQQQSEVTETVENTETTGVTQEQESFENRVESSVNEQQKKDDTFVGQVKWFNNRLGYGFITIITPGEHLMDDIFVHQQHINPKSSDYRSLQQGEYVSFQLGVADSDAEAHNDGYPNQAIAVTGVFGGSLLCDQIPRRGLPGLNARNPSNPARHFNRPRNNFGQNPKSNQDLESEQSPDQHRGRGQGQGRGRGQGRHNANSGAASNGGWQRVGQRNNQQSYDMQEE